MDPDIFGPEWGRRGLLGAVAVGTTRLVGGLLGNPRLARCGEGIIFWATF